MDFKIFKVKGEKRFWHNLIFVFLFIVAKIFFNENSPFAAV
jgi:hypothetical protein